jgi:ATP-dependent Lhr-like helicase
MFSPNKSSRRSTEDWDEKNFFELVRAAWPYRNLTRGRIRRASSKCSPKVSARNAAASALIHHDAINHRIRGRAARD